MKASRPLRSVLRALVYHYCRHSPVRRGKVKLIFATRRVEIPYMVEAILSGGSRITADIVQFIESFGYRCQKITDDGLAKFKYDRNRSSAAE